MNSKNSCKLPFYKNIDAKVLIAQATIASENAYNIPEPMTTFRMVNIYWLDHPIAAQVLVSSLPNGRKRWMVTFRGTILEKAGNWLFANTQAYKTKYAEYPLEGQVHMGFYRGFHWLWSGKNEEPKIETNHMAKLKSRAWKRRLIGTIFLSALIWFGNLSGWISKWNAAVLAVTYLLVVLVELGIVENWFKRKVPKPHGKGLEETLAEVEAGDEVVFTGHSLGGAMAMHAIVKFRAANPNIKSYLITFGAPRAGDQPWMTDFEKKIEPQNFLHVVNVGDPVPEVPGTFKQAIRLPWNAGYLLPILILAGILRAVWAFMYQQSRPGSWPVTSRKLVGEFPFRVKNHSMDVYITELRKEP